MKTILGVSAYYHDSAAAVVVNGEIIAAAQEERFTRKKHDACFPLNAITYCLQESGKELSQVDAIVFYDKPLLKFERLLETYLAYAPKGFRSFSTAMPIWLKEKLLLKSILKKEFKIIGECSADDLPKLLFSEHHQSHAASAFYPSPFDKAAILCLDGVGEWATTSVWQGQGNKLNPMWEIQFPHSLGLLYSAFTYYTGFKVNSGEYKLMGLAPYGEPKYVNKIYENLIDVKSDGTFRLNMEYFNYATGLTMTSNKFNRLFGAPPRKPESELSQKEMDLARSIQVVTEEIVLKLSETIYKETSNKNLCLAGGVALNCVSNGRLIREGKFEEVWIQPAAGDAGGAIGAALLGWYQYYDNGREVSSSSDKMHGSYLGPKYSAGEINKELGEFDAQSTKYSSNELYSEIANVLSQDKVVGWFQGRMEFGPRALGNRSILGDPRSPKMQSIMNLKIKFRESFRPFAPAVLAEEVSNVFDHNVKSPYMLVVSPLKVSRRKKLTSSQESLFGIEKLNVPRSDLPAITHVDYSARVQTVHSDTNPEFYSLISEFNKKTGCPVLVNTSFNVRGEPIVNTPADAYRCFMRTNMDYLVLGNFVLRKEDQPEFIDDKKWKTEFELD